jgi:hypothetical protein
MKRELVLGRVHPIYALCIGRELSINLQCQANKRNLLVGPGNLIRAKQRGAAAGYSISEEAI